MPTYDPDVVEKQKYNIDLKDNKEEWSPMYFLNGRPIRFVAYWSGRGLHYELGKRVYMQMLRENRHVR